MAGFGDFFMGDGSQPTAQAPLAGVSPLAKVFLALGGTNAVDSTIKTNLDRANQAAMSDIAKRMQSGELDRQGALLEFARRTGDASKLFQQDTTPAAIQEYNFINGLSPEEQALYFRNKRANQMFDRGDAQVVLDAQGNPVREFAKALAPEDRPETKAAQTTATKTAEAEVTRDTEKTKKAISADDTLSTIEEAEGLLKNATGSYPDAAATFVNSRVLGNSTDASKANAQLKVVAGKLTLAQPRMEGPQSDKDAALYREMAANIGDPTVPAEDKQAALTTIKNLQSKYASKNQVREGDPVEGELLDAPNLDMPDDVLQPPPSGKATKKSAGSKTIDFGSL